MTRACSHQDCGGWNGSSPAGAAAAGEALCGVDPTGWIAAWGDSHAVELAITFEDGAGEAGAGTTRIISAEEVRFVTSRAPVIGQRIAGAIHFSPGPDGVATDLSYVARVTTVAVTADSYGVFEVTARFEHLAFVARRARG